MAEIEDIGSFDVIIIGAGMGGLVAGTALVDKGYRVLIIEKHIIPGGFTTNFERKDFRFEVSTPSCERRSSRPLPVLRVGGPIAR